MAAQAGSSRSSVPLGTIWMPDRVPTRRPAFDRCPFFGLAQGLSHPDKAGVHSAADMTHVSEQSWALCEAYN
jgi:hypothetical protein